MCGRLDWQGVHDTYHHHHQEEANGRADTNRHWFGKEATKYLAEERKE
jgi:hypothetical protein